MNSRQHASTPLPEPLPPPAIPVLFQDADLVAVDKPAGLLVHRTPMSGDRIALHQLLAAQLGERLFGVHRLDRGASGVLVFGRSAEAARTLHSALRSPTSAKIYLAVVRDVAPEQLRIDRPLKGKSGQPQPATTELRRLARVDRHSLVEIRIRTGRRHQIRRHLKGIAHHVLGDTTHGKGRINAYLREHFGLPRLALHAWHLEFFHPFTGEYTALRAPLAEDLRAFLLRLPGADPRQIAEL